MKPLSIEIEKIGRKTMTGSSILAMYPDLHTPILDIFVRESIQNSLDATNNSKRYVRVDYHTGNFHTQDLSQVLEGMKNILTKQYAQDTYRFLSVRDSFTKGLTGKLSIQDVKDYNYGNLIKLVYDICKPQENEGAGGSWGLGKSIYFRLGIGMVFYYSRIKLEDGSFQSRLAGILVENEKSTNPLIKRDDKQLNSGVAWWGCPTKSKHTIPITDEKWINEFLAIFGQKPFLNEQTGTEIIIPFVDENYLLKHNRSEHQNNDDEDVPQRTFPWTTDIKSYLKLAVQRWYFPRLNNLDYKYGNYLKVYINGSIISKDDMHPLFRIGQSLYNIAATGNNDDEYLAEKGLEVFLSDIRLRKDLIVADCSAGYVASVLVDKNELGMCPPDNNYAPYCYLDLEEEVESNRAIFTYCRKPGMLVSYMDEDVKWTNRVPHTDLQSYIIGIFVLNSDTYLRSTGDKVRLEEYVRKGEMANHNRWSDHVFGGESRTIIQRIQSNTSHKLASAYTVQDTFTDEPKKVSGLGQLMANMILPPTGFGKRSTKPKAVGVGTSTKFIKHKDFKYALIPDSMYYDGDTVEVEYRIQTHRPINHFCFKAYINSETGILTPEDWEGNGLEMPFEITKVNVRLDKWDAKACSMIYSFSNDENIFTCDLFSANWVKTPHNICHGISFHTEGEHQFDMYLTFSFCVYKRDLQPVIKAE